MIKSNLSLACIGEYSSFPKYICNDCEQELWTEKSERTNWQEWLITKKGIRHFKTRCNHKKTAEAKQ